MKILEHGMPPIVKVYTLRCHNCSTKFEFQRHEAEFVPDQRDGDYLRVHCPVCGQCCTHNL